MKPSEPLLHAGDLVHIVANINDDYCGLGLFLEASLSRTGQRYVYKFLWNGSIGTFDLPYWRFEVISESR